MQKKSTFSNKKKVTYLNATFLNHVENTFHSKIIDSSYIRESHISQILFKDGGTMLVWVFRPSDSSGSIPLELERCGHVRLSIQFSATTTEREIV